MIEHQGPTYLRLGRPKVPVVYADGCNFEIGKAITVREGSDVTVIANGLMLPMALDAAAELGEPEFRPASSICTPPSRSTKKQS